MGVWNWGFVFFVNFFYGVVFKVVLVEEVLREFIVCFECVYCVVVDVFFDSDMFVLICIFFCYLDMGFEIERIWMMCNVCVEVFLLVGVWEVSVEVLMGLFLYDVWFESVLVFGSMVCVDLLDCLSDMCVGFYFIVEVEISVVFVGV